MTFRVVKSADMQKYNLLTVMHGEDSYLRKILEKSPVFEQFSSHSVNSLAKGLFDKSFTT